MAIMGAEQAWGIPKSCQLQLFVLDDVLRKGGIIILRMTSPI